MPVFVIAAVGMLCAVLGALFMGFSSENRSPVTFSVITVGYVALVFLLWSVTGRMLLYQCGSFQQMCTAKSEFESLFGVMLRDETRAVAVFLSSGLSTLFCLAYAMYVGVYRTLNTKLLVWIGCLLFLVGSGMGLYGLFASP